ncbi:MAG: hypothetical protein HY459_03230 [Parcubacteria group bacterium]|nr:hypothetical protein [Parcubacteria group bacterium]
MRRVIFLIVLGFATMANGFAHETSMRCISQEEFRRSDGLSEYVALVSHMRNPQQTSMIVAARPMKMGFQEALKTTGIKATWVEANGNQFIGLLYNHDELYRLTLGQELYNNSEIREAKLNVLARSPVEKTMICFIEN